MKSGYKIAWTNKALTDLDTITQYLEANWADKEISKFFQRFDQRVDLISQRPQLYPLSKQRKNVRKSVLIPQLSLYYRINRNTVEILTLFDSRQNPSKLKLK